MTMRRFRSKPTKSKAASFPPWALVIATLAAAPALAQTVNMPNALQGFSTNRNQPIDIKSASLEIRDKNKIATFRENVHVVNGDTTLQCDTMVVEYDLDEAVAGGKPALTSRNDAQPIRRIDVTGSVLVARNDQTATADSGVFDMRANTATLSGNVVVSQGQCVVRAERLTVDLETGMSRFENPQGGAQTQSMPGRCAPPKAVDH
jgi:lipopolysaccharide export system protein LptA